MSSWLRKGAMGLLVVLLLAGLASLSCGKKSEEVNTLNIGAIVSVTGVASTWGIPLQKSILLRVDQINMAGGITIGGKTYRINVFCEDDGYSTEKGVTALNKLIFERNVKIVWGSVATGASLAEAPIAQQNGVLFISGGKGTGVMNKNTPLVFLPAMTQDIIQPVYWKWISENVPEVKRVALIYPQNPTGQGTAAAAEAAIDHYGLDVVYKTSFSSTTTDFYPALTTLLASNPDWIEGSECTATQIGLIMKQARELGYTGRFGDPTASGADPIVAIAGAAADGLITNAYITEGSYAVEGLAEFKQAYIERYGVWDEIAAMAVPYVDMPFLGIRAADSLDPVKIGAALEEIGMMEFPTGTAYWTGEELYGINHVLVSDVCISQIQNGKSVGVGKINGSDALAIVNEYYE